MSLAELETLLRQVQRESEHAGSRERREELARVAAYFGRQIEEARRR